MKQVKGEIKKIAEREIIRDQEEYFYQKTIFSNFTQRR